MTAFDPARKLRDLLATRQLIRAPSAVDGLSAKLIGAAGFLAVHVSKGFGSRREDVSEAFRNGQVEGGRQHGRQIDRSGW